MTVNWDRPFSSNISRIGHDPDSDELFVEWRGGRISVYTGVTAAQYDQTRKSPSVTQAINMEIKPRHKHRYLPSD